MGVEMALSIPALRFPEFTDSWKTLPVSEVVKRASDPVLVDADATYREIGVRSHGKGIFHKDPVKGVALGNKRVFWVHPNAFVVNIVFGWEQAVALTSESEKGFIASHRFPMFIPRKGHVDLDFFLSFFLRKRGKYLLELASPGGAGRNKTLGQKEFLGLEVTIPGIREQKKIAAILATVDNKLAKLRRKYDLLTEYKRGMMQQICSQQVRFRRDDGSVFPDWTEKNVGAIFFWIKTNSYSRAMLANTGSVQNIHYGDIHTRYGTQFHQASSDAPYLAEDLTKSIKGEEYCRVGDLVIADASEDYEDIGKAIEIMSAGERSLVAGLHTYLARPKAEIALGYMGYAFQYPPVRKKIKTIAQGISVLGLPKKYLESVLIPMPSEDEQKKIADFLSAIDSTIAAVSTQITRMEAFKKGLLQQLFV